jgi:hypothetical protein
MHAWACSAPLKAPLWPYFCINSTFGTFHFTSDNLLIIILLSYLSFQSHKPISMLLHAHSGARASWPPRPFNIASDAPIGLRNEIFNRYVLFFHLYPQMSHMAKSDWLATICHDNSRLSRSSVEYINELNSLSSALATSWLWRIWTSFRALNVSKLEHLVTVNLTFSCDTTRYHGHKCRAPQIYNPVHF